MHLLSAALHTLPITQFLARGGGGGSGGGGSAGAYGVLAAVGFAPTYFSSDWCTRAYNKRVGFWVGMLVTLAVGVGFGSFMLLFAPFEFIVIMGGALVGVATGCANLIAKAREKSAKLKKRIAVSAATDPVWQEEKLQARIDQTFYEYQKDWTDFNLAHIQTYVTPRYFEHISLMLAALKTMDRQNIVANPKLLEKYIVTMTDSEDNNKDSFVAVIAGKADDRLVETTTQNVLYTDNSQFEESWHFLRQGDAWLLDRIEQGTADTYEEFSSLRKFAKENGMFYSLDWGWLLLPKRGQLFGAARFKFSDINNHVIGNWHGIIVQMYTYKPTKSEGDNYLVAQITLPKSYGGILIRRRRFVTFAPGNYQRISFEWPDFNKRFTVYATDADKVTSFELLNPKFMTYLYDTDLKAEIEVVDNVVYIYSRNIGLEDKYKHMLEILRQAFRELKM